jgi:CubicO group peptidase (beta-lactamase class C family)
MANLELNVPLNTDQVFRIGSNTKQFTAVAILRLAEQGKLSLQDSINKFIKNYPTHGKKITIENLLTHTSGIKNYTSISKWTQDIMRKDLSPKELVDLFKDEPMDFEPGTDYRYDNSGYVLLGYIIELVSGKTYAQYISEEFFQPLGMKNSYYDNAAAIISNRAPGYKKNVAGYVNADMLSMTLPYAAGSLLSNVDDMFKWYQALMGGKVLSTSSLKNAHTSYQLPNGRKTGYGYGWEIGNVQGVASIKHVGVVNGFVTYAAYIPSENIFVVILSNCECAGDLDVPASKIAALLLGKPYIFNKMVLPLNELEKYQGVYNTAFEGKKIITVQDGQLYYYVKGGNKSLLIPYAKDKFYIDNTLLTLNFERTKGGSISGFIFNNTGIPFSGKSTGESILAKVHMDISAVMLLKYEGKYQFSNFIFEVVKEGDKLYGKVGRDKKELVPFSANKFFAKDIDATIIFNTDPDGKVLGLTKIQNGEMVARKVE